jgi:hypothetical protein
MNVRLHTWIGALLLVGLSIAAAVGAENPPAPGFDLEGSDPAAIEIADRVMAAMGGRDAWDGTRYLSWRFFDRRDHLWDRWTGDLRLEAEDSVVLMNVGTREGRAWKNGQELAGTELAEALDGGYKAWVNDSYWLIMPYKLKDSGVTLTHVGAGQTEAGEVADILRLTFEDVGVTPQNKYHVWVARDTDLVEQWAFFPTADLEDPAFVTPWGNWQRYGEVLLSDDRGEGRFETAISRVRVYDEVSPELFERPDAELP